MHGTQGEDFLTGGAPALTDHPVVRRTVAYDPDTRVLRVGDRSVAVTCRPGDNECILRTYLSLVMAQRGLGPDAIILRRDDVVVLSELLDVSDDMLEVLLQRLLRISARDARELHRRLVRTRVAAAVGVGLLASAPLTRGAFDQDTTTVAAVAPASATAEVEAAPLPDPALPVAVAADPKDASGVPAPAPARLAEPSTSSPAASAPTTPAPEVEIGEPLVIERDPSEVPPTDTATPPPPPAEPAESEGEQADADIGTAYRYERDPAGSPEGADIGSSLTVER